MSKYFIGTELSTPNPELWWTVITWNSIMIDSDWGRHTFFCGRCVTSSSGPFDWFGNLTKIKSNKPLVFALCAKWLCIHFLPITACNCMYIYKWHKFYNCYILAMKFFGIWSLDEAPQQMSLVWSLALEDDITDFAPWSYGIFVHWCHSCHYKILINLFKCQFEEQGDLYNCMVSKNVRDNNVKNQ